MDIRRKLTLLLYILLLLVFSGTALAAPISEETAWLVARNFIKRHEAAHDGWKGHHNPTPASIEVVRYKGEPIAYNVSVNPGGHLLVAYYDDFSPVLFYSTSSPLDPSNADDPNAIESWIIPEIYNIIQHLKKLKRPSAIATAVGGGSLKRSSTPAARFANRIENAWNLLKDAAVDQSTSLPSAAATASGTYALSVGPLLTTTWNQSLYYNQYTPSADGCTHTLTGCVATAMAQVMKYWNWPDTGTGSHSYLWNGTTLSADFTHPYNWSSMPAALTDSSTPDQVDAVARLMSDVGISVYMLYGCGSSGAWPFNARNSLRTYFKYKNTASLINREPRRWSQTATMLSNGRVLIVGGQGDNDVLSSAELYDPSTGVFSATEGMASARVSHTATVLPNGQVLVAGGIDYPGHISSSAELYDPATGVFSATGGMASARVFHTATMLPNGQVLIVGGQDDNDVLRSAELYDPDTGSFAATGSMTSVRENHTATLLPNGQVLFAGGQNWDMGSLSSAELYDPSTGVFSATGGMASARVSHTATVLPNGQVLFAGGLGSEIVALSSAELYDPDTSSFSATGDMASARVSHTATVLPIGQVLIAGGEGINFPLVFALGSTELYDPATGGFSNSGNMTTARKSNTATLLPNGQVLFAGGLGSEIVALSSAELYDPDTANFVATGGMGTADWMGTIASELNAATPRVMLLTIKTLIGNSGHAVVIDGYQTSVSGTDQVHINYGWGGGADGYYDITSNWTAGYEWVANNQFLIIGIEPAGRPGAPTNVTATAGNAQATVSFTSPADDGGSTITGYTVTSDPVGGVDSDAGTTATTHTITGLANGTPYTFNVTATSVAGIGPASAPSNSVTPFKLSTTVSLGSLTHTYDATQKSATATTVPPGLNVRFTYNGSFTAPTSADSYAVVATIDDGTYEGSATITGALTRTAGENVGAYAINQNDLTAGSNYNLTYVGANLTIDPAPLTVTADARSKTYGAADPALTYTATGFVNGESAAVLTGALGRSAGETVAGSPYAITQGTLAGSNYSITYTGANLTIDPAPLTVTADARSKTYGAVDPALTYQITGGALVGSDTITGALSRTPG
jgi:hypothetical protein